MPISTIIAITVAARPSVLAKIPISTMIATTVAIRPSVFARMPISTMLATTVVTRFWALARIKTMTMNVTMVAQRRLEIIPTLKRMRTMSAITVAVRSLKTALMQRMIMTTNVIFAEIRTFLITALATQPVARLQPVPSVVPRPALHLIMRMKITTITATIIAERTIWVFTPIRTRTMTMSVIMVAEPSLRTARTQKTMTTTIVTHAEKKT